MKLLCSLILCSVLQFISSDIVHGQNDCDGYNTGQSWQECEETDLVGGVGIGCEAPTLIKVYDDQFDGPNIDESFWHIWYGASEYTIENPGPNEYLHWSRQKSWYEISYASILDGNLRLKALHDPLYNQEVQYNWTPSGTYSSYYTDFEFRSSAVKSKFNFTNPYGTMIRSRIKMDIANRAFYAFWMYGVNRTGTTTSEIDIFEIHPDGPNHPVSDCWTKDKYINLQRVNIHFNDQFECASGHYIDGLSNYNIYEFQWDRYYGAWRTGNSLSSMTEIRKDWWWIALDGTQLSCTNFEKDNPFVHGIYKQALRVPSMTQAIYFNHYIFNDYYNQGYSDHVTPKYMDIDYVEVFQEVACLGDVVYNSISDIDIGDNIYNVRLIHDGEFNNVIIPSQRALKIIASGDVTLNSGTTFDPDSYIDIESRSGIYCGVTPWYTVETIEGQSLNVNGGLVDYVWDNQVDEELTSNSFDESSEADLKGKIRIYPNPASSTLSIDLDPAVGSGHFIIIDGQGKEIFSGVFIEDTKHMEVNLFGLPPGTYLIQFLSNSGRIIAKETFVKI